VFEITLNNDEVTLIPFKVADVIAVDDKSFDVTVDGYDILIRAFVGILKLDIIYA
jgi:hypothetical protein